MCHFFGWKWYPKPITTPDFYEMELVARVNNVEHTFVLTAVDNAGPHFYERLLEKDIRCISVHRALSAELA
jgi:hypothetical protein